MINNTLNLIFLNEMNNLGGIDLVFEGGITYQPIDGMPYAELYYLPAANEDINMDNADYQNRGIFQITLRYPNKMGMANILNQCDTYVAHFKKGAKFTRNDMVLRIDETPKVVNMGIENDRVVYVVSINYKAYVDSV